MFGKGTLRHSGPSLPTAAHKVIILITSNCTAALLEDHIKASRLLSRRTENEADVKNSMVWTRSWLSESAVRPHNARTERDYCSMFSCYHVRSVCPCQETEFLVFFLFILLSLHFDLALGCTVEEASDIGPKPAHSARSVEFHLDGWSEEVGSLIRLFLLR